MSLPKVTIVYTNGNLLQAIQNLDGIAGIVGTGSTSALLGVPLSVNSLDDAVNQGITEDAEPDMYRHLSEFYGELGGNQQLYIMLVPNTMTMAQMLDITNSSGALKLLNFGEGQIRLLGVFRHPISGYDGGTDFIDADVSAAFTKALTFGQGRLAVLDPLRILIEGRVQNPNAANTLSPNTMSNGYAGSVLGGSLTDGSASIGLALGRAVKYGAEIKLGKVANGALNINQVYIGATALKDVANLETLHDAGFISFMTHPQKSGFYFGIDNMASTDDYRLLAYGRIIDKAALIAAAVYTEQIESEVDLDSTGHLATDTITNLEQKIIQQIGVGMGSQISGDAVVVIDPNQDIEDTSLLTMKLSIIPKGYTSYITINLGLQAPTSN